MADFEQNDKNSFMIEQIKERPINRKKLLRRMVITASMAVIFGLIACFTFLVLEPVLSNMLYPPPEESEIVIFPEDELEEEMQPEEMLSEKLQTEIEDAASEEVKALEEETEQIKEMISNNVLTLENYKQLYDALDAYATDLSRYMTRITAVSSDTDWISDATNESEHETGGIIVAETSKEILILTDYRSIKNAEKLMVSFYNDYSIEAKIYSIHEESNLALISVNYYPIVRQALGEEKITATFGTSNIRRLVGTPVLIMGCPMGDYGSLGYGMIVSDSGTIVTTDANYKMLTTDISGKADSTGVLFNLDGQVVGIVNRTSMDAEDGNMVTAYGITELKYLINCMSQKGTVPYMGIEGIDVTNEANVENDVPYGAYITEISIGSPAMLAGLQEGDVITFVEDQKITEYVEYTVSLLKKNAGDIIKVKAMRLVQNEYKEMEFEITLQ